jgi:hypothetical protein
VSTTWVWQASLEFACSKADVSVRSPPPPTHTLRPRARACPVHSLRASRARTSYPVSAPVRCAPVQTPQGVFQGLVQRREQHLQSVLGRVFRAPEHASASAAAGSTLPRSLPCLLVVEPQLRLPPAFRRSGSGSSSAGGAGVPAGGVEPAAPAAEAMALQS